MTKPTTSADRMRSLRAKDKINGVAEVRGIRAKSELHAKIKAAAERVKKAQKG